MLHQLLGMWSIKETQLWAPDEEAEACVVVVAGACVVVVAGACVVVVAGAWVVVVAGACVVVVAGACVVVVAVSLEPALPPLESTTEQPLVFVCTTHLISFVHAARGLTHCDVHMKHFARLATTNDTNRMPPPH